MYELPRGSPDGVYNIVLHGLLELKIDEQKTVLVEVETDFDAECLGLHMAPKMEILQHLHLSNE